MKVKGTIEGKGRNVYVLMAHFRRLANEQGWKRGHIDAVLNEAQCGDFDHLYKTLSDNMTMKVTSDE